jgi:hypothetical protein
VQLAAMRRDGMRSMKELYQMLTPCMTLQRVAPNCTETDF